MVNPHQIERKESYYMNKIFYKPNDAWAADVIPFFKDGVFHIFYLKDWRDPKSFGEGTPWYKITTTDFVNFNDHGEMLSRGASNEQDQYVFTGCVIESDGKYHIFYTGHNHQFYSNADEKIPGQAIMHAVSDDLEAWTKIPDDTFIALSDEYEVHDWRDPFVFYDKDKGEYVMILAARKKGVHKLLSGCTAMCVSKDLKNWELREPFWEPHLYYTHECPDLFNIGDWWYQVFSEFSDCHVTRYRMAKSINGPWLLPRDDMFDGRAYYAAKTISDGDKRYIIGWNPTKEGNSDKGLWQWGGSLVVHEIYQNNDGTLGVKIPEAVDNAFANPVEIAFHELNGNKLYKSPVSLSKISGTQIMVCDNDLPDVYKLEATVKFAGDSTKFGILLNYSVDEDGGYVYLFDPYKQKVNFEYWPNFPQYRYNGKTCERPFTFEPNIEYKLKIIVEGGICLLYLDDKIALGARMYERTSGKIALLVCDGDVEFKEINISHLNC